MHTQDLFHHIECAVSVLFGSQSLRLNLITVRDDLRRQFGQNVPDGETPDNKKSRNLSTAEESFEAHRYLHSKPLPYRQHRLIFPPRIGTFFKGAFARLIREYADYHYMCDECFYLATAAQTSTEADFLLKRSG